MLNTLNNMNRAQNDLFSSSNFGGNPNEPKCCFIFPYSWGIFFISVMIVIDGTNQYTLMKNMYDVSHFIFAIELIAFLPVILAFALFIYYFIKDTKQSRGLLTLACFMMMISNVVAYAGIVIGALVVEDIPTAAIMTLLPVNGLGALMYFYFKYIC